MTDPWNPTQYDKFQREREQPFFDLLAMVRPAPRMRAVDLGCGTGRLTRILHERLQPRETLGLDRSAQMLDRQRGEPPLDGLTFEVGAIEDFPGDRGSFDLIFSNAALHWVADHETLFAKLASALSPAGQLAIQMPSSHDDPSHTLAEELIQSEPYRSASGGWRRPQHVNTPVEYARLLHRLGFPDPEVRLIVYPHLLSGPEDVIEWMKGTLLTDYARRFEPDMFARFVDDYRERLLARLERARPYFFPFKRILCRAQRSA